MVDKNYVEGQFEDVAGKVEEGAGYVTGSPGARFEGKVRQAAGQAQAMFGRAADTASKTSAQMAGAARERPLLALLIAGAVGFMLGRSTARR